MNKPNLEDMEIKSGKKAEKRNKRKRPKMRISGIGVKKLEKLVRGI
jgi:hypothetical protein